MGVQVHHVAQFDKDVVGEVAKWLKYLKGQATHVQFLTTTVPDPKAPEKWRVQYEAYITYQHQPFLAVAGGSRPSALST